MHGISRSVFWTRTTTVLDSGRPRANRFFSAIVLSLCAGLLLLCSARANAQAESAPATAPPPAQDAPAAQAHPDQTAAEIASHEEATTFKVNVKLVTVRVVVRDAQGHAVGNLHKEDFELFDNRKPQVISHFSVEQPGSQAARDRTTSDQKTGTASIPEHYVAFVFDDIHLKFGDLVPARLAADKHLATMLPTDRAAIFTTSGQTVLDFTDDRAKLHDTLLRLQPRPVTGSGVTECPDISYYMADLIVNKQDGQAIQAATQDALACLPQPSTPGSANPAPAPSLIESQSIVRSEAYRQLAVGGQESRIALYVLRDIVRRMSVMPGQRSLILVSPGFLTPETDMLSDYMDVVEKALHSEVVISALDARGLYAVLPGGDISREVPLTGYAAAVELQYQTQSAEAEGEILEDLSDATGGAFFHNNNDLNEGFKRVAATPEYFYTLGFSPQNLKLDGGYHKLKVSLKKQPGLTLQARRGYYAPKHAADPAEEAKEEIQDAIFSQEEMHGLPVQLHTQFFKPSDAEAKLSVLAHVDVKDIHYRKVDGRNANELTVVSVVFNQNGVFVQGSQKNVTMRWKDETLAKLNSGITLKTSFDVKPGSYLVRLVVRDSEGQLMSAENGAIEIP